MLHFMAPISPSHQSALDLYNRIQQIKEFVSLDKFETISYCEEMLGKISDKMDTNKLSKVEKIINGFDHKGSSIAVIDKKTLQAFYEDYRDQVVHSFVEELVEDGQEYEDALQMAASQWEEEAASHLNSIQKDLEYKWKRDLTEAEEAYLYNLTE